MRPPARPRAAGPPARSREKEDLAREPEARSPREGAAAAAPRAWSRTAPGAAGGASIGTPAGTSPDTVAPAEHAASPEATRRRDGVVHPGGRSASGGADHREAGGHVVPALPEVVSTRMADRLAERDAERAAMARHRFWVRAGWVVGAAAAAAALGWGAFFSPLLALAPEQVVVTGEGSTVDVAQVRDALDDDAGVPLPRLDTVAMRERVLALNAVKDVRITRAWPDGLDVVLTAREPVAAAPGTDGYALLDPEGVQVGVADPPPDGLPIVSVPLDAEPATGALALAAALRVLGALPPDLSSQVAEVSADTQDDVQTRLHDGALIHWGNGDRIALKVRVVQALRAAEPGARILDVSSPELPVTR